MGVGVFWVLLFSQGWLGKRKVWFLTYVLPVEISFTVTVLCKLKRRGRGKGQRRGEEGDTLNSACDPSRAHCYRRSSFISYTLCTHFSNANTDDTKPYLPWLAVCSFKRSLEVRLSGPELPGSSFLPFLQTLNTFF